MIIIKQGRFHQDYICSICGWKAPWLEIRAKGWGKSQVARKMVRDHIRSIHPNQALDSDGKKPPQVS